MAAAAKSSPKGVGDLCMDDFPLFKHVDSFDLCSKHSPSRKNVSDDSPDLSDLSASIDDRSLVQSELSATPLNTNKDKGSIPSYVVNPWEVGYTEHLRDQMWKRGYTTRQFRDIIQFGCRWQEPERDRWSFMYQRVLVVTDSNVEVGITMYEYERDTNCARCDSENDTCACGFCKGCCKNSDESNPRCPGCKRRGLKLCARGFCGYCCFGCYICTGEDESETNSGEGSASGIPAYVTRGSESDTNSEESNRWCPGCRERVPELCARGFCRCCCYGCSICTCPGCRRKIEKCDRGYCADCCWGCPKCLGGEEASESDINTKGSGEEDDSYSSEEDKDI